MSAVIEQEKKPEPSRQLTIRERLNTPAIVQEIGRALPKHMSAERMARVALTAITRTPDLAKCTESSFFRCLLDLSQYGLEPDGRHAHLIPFRNNKTQTTECTLIIDYKGLVTLAYRSGMVKSIHADVVHSGDLFVYSLGTVEQHVPWAFRTDANKPAEQGKIIAAYAMVRLTGDASKCEVLTLDEVEGIRKRSRSGGSGPWVTDFSEMAKKTAFRRVSKWLPLSAEILDLMDRDDDKLERLDSQVISAMPIGSRTELLESKLDSLMADVPVE